MVATTFYAFRIASRVAQEKSDASGWREALVAVAVVAQLILLMNALAFVSHVVIAAHEMPEEGGLLERQLWLLLGTAGLMALTAAALGDESVREASSPSEAAGAALTAVVERLLVRFWWAAIGVGVVFGVAARGVALLLAIELTLVWVVGRVIRRAAPSGPGPRSPLR